MSHIIKVSPSNTHFFAEKSGLSRQETQYEMR